jgi:uncharacterized membrane protein
MPLPHLAYTLAGPLSHPPGNALFAFATSGAGATLLIALRFAHIVAGILWVGLLYFFNLVNLRFLRDLDPETRVRIYPRLMRPTLWWFRWASVVTVFVGIWYWMIIVGEDKANALSIGITPHPGRSIGSFFVIWTFVSFVMIGILSMGKLNTRGPLLAIIFALLVAAAAWLYVSLNSSGWESNRQLSIGIGGGLGWVMMNNVWGVLWRAQKRLIRWAEMQSNGTRSPGAPPAPMPPELQKLSLLSAVTARANFCLTFPMLFFMAASSHYVLFLAR